VRALSTRARIVVAWLPAVLYTSLIWWLSSRALDVPLMGYVPLQDKGVHFLEYGALSLFITHAIATTWRERGVRALIAASLVTTALGLMDELHQAFVPGRSSDDLDLMADAIGAFFFSAAYLLLLHWLALRSARLPGAGAESSSPRLSGGEATSESRLE